MALFFSTRQRIYGISSAIIVFIALAGLSIWNHERTKPAAISPNSLNEVRENSSQYQFINPLLFVGLNKSLYTAEFKPLVDSLNDYIDSVNGNSATQVVSVYFNNLNNGHWTGVNENDMYEPGSMLKVGVMVGYYKSAESDPDLLSKKLYYPGPDTTGQYYVPTDHLASGYYTIGDLISDMIIYSDNVALEVLMKNDPNQYLSIAHDFRLPLPPSNGNPDYMSPRQYSTIFRALYNSSYLSWDQSEQALQLLASTTFTQGIVSGVPSNVVVSHKFGEYSDSFGPDDSLITKELHDCGVVYYPGNPYFLCVMTKGDDFSTLQGIISHVSSIVYDYVASSTPSASQ